jgi:hypothetical protein
MKKQTDKNGLRQSVECFFSTVDDLLEKGKLSAADKDWLEKELAEMEQKLKAYKLSKAASVVAS